jgi:xanthine dehydrogenase accessory factor
VTKVWGSAPRAEGATLLATKDGVMVGSVSGGCVENAVVEEIMAALEGGESKQLSYGVTHERAWEFGLACGGTIGVFVEPRVRPELLDAAKRPEGSVVATVIGGAAPIGAALIVYEDGKSERLGLPEHFVEPVAKQSLERLGSLMSRAETIEVGGETIEVLFEVFPRQPTIFMFGAVHVAMALTTLAKPLGYRVVVADGRAAFLTRERFPLADELVLAWPEEAFAKIGIDSATCICILSHDPKFDDPALDIAIRSPAVYIGAIGSRKTQALRRERLKSQGLSDADVARLHGPIGLDLGGREPGEIALAILAEITAVRYGKAAVGR